MPASTAAAAAATTEELDLLTIQEAADLMRLSRSALYTLMDAGEIRFIKYGRQRRNARRIRRSVIVEWIESMETQGKWEEGPASQK